MVGDEVTLQVCQAELTMMMAKRRYGEGMGDLSPPPEVRLVLAMGLIGAMGKMGGLSSLLVHSLNQSRAVTTAKSAMKRIFFSKRSHHFWRHE